MSRAFHLFRNMTCVVVQVVRKNSAVQRSLEWEK